MRLRGRLRPRPCVRNPSKTDRGQTRGAGRLHRPAPRGARAAAHERRSQRLRSGAALAAIMPEQEKAFHAAGATEKQWIGKPPLLYAVVCSWRAIAGGGTAECCFWRAVRRQAEPPGCAHPLSGNRAAPAEGWARPSLMVAHVGARCQRAQDSCEQYISRIIRRCADSAPRRRSLSPPARLWE